MTESSEVLAFPALQFSEGSVFPVRDNEILTTCSQSALQGTFFTHSKLIDATGAEFNIRGARRLGGIGAFWGYNLFLNRRIRVQLDLKSTGSTLGLDEVKRRVTQALRSSHSWAGSSEVAELLSGVVSADSINEIVVILAAAYGEKSVKQ